ncbi:MAG: SDR family NAD(P)-dependent oxidoreductase [Actinobacteria bacterium]|nr:SDR family NAD(P)-dependent oxidoreductase [Actinomycetota bacterium]
MIGRRGASSKRPIAEQVVVITGASSGIGREAAHQFAEAGATVVLAARNEQALRAAAREVETLGGTALVVPTDVSDWAQVAALAETTRDRFGRIDTWVNGAVVSSYGFLADTPVEAIDEVLSVGLRGQFHGVRAALPIMRSQGSGTIIGISSVLGVRSVPLQVPYAAAKHGTTALYEGLRVEERIAGTGVDATAILPATVNTPFYDVVPSFLGTRPPLVPPVYQPSAVAEAILHAAEHPTRHVLVGVAGPLYALQRLSPRLFDVCLHLAGRTFLDRRDAPVDRGQSNHHAPIPGEGATVGRARVALPHSRYTRTVGLRPARAAVTVALASALLLRRHRRG